MSYSENIDDFIKNLDKKFIIKKYKDFKDLNNDAAKLIAENNIIARCAGREEWELELWETDRSCVIHLN